MTRILHFHVHLLSTPRARSTVSFRLRTTKVYTPYSLNECVSTVPTVSPFVTRNRSGYSMFMDLYAQHVTRYACHYDGSVVIFSKSVLKGQWWQFVETTSSYMKESRRRYRVKRVMLRFDADIGLVHLLLQRRRRSLR